MGSPASSASALPGRCPVGRMVQKTDFERVLATPTRSRSLHFAVHHMSSGPSRPAWRPKQATAAELSTDPAPSLGKPVDNLPSGHWLGTVVPKRHAKRSVTRSLLKRQMRALMDRHAAGLPPGLWLLRLRSPFAPKQFPSAASDALRAAACAELEQLLSRLASAASAPAPNPAAGV